MVETNSMSENTPNVEVQIDEERDLGEPPHFYSPYPEKLIQIKEGETRGARDCIKIINENWKENIDDLVDISKDEFDGGYSGSFIRSILRSHYIPAEAQAETEIETEQHRDRQSMKTAGERGVSPENGDDEDSAEDKQKQKAFRYGILVALQTDLSREQATNLFGRGFGQGIKLIEEMDNGELERFR